MPSEAPFSKLLRKHRHAAGYSQEDLAERAGLSAAAIGSLEQGLRRAPYRDTVTSLADALGLSESERRELEQVAARARGRQPRGDSGLPISLTSFIERPELDELKALLSERRLLTITGSPGIGKTRIAIELARRVEDRFDEMWFLDLLPVRGGALVGEQVALRLDVGADGDDPLLKIIRSIRSRHTLLIVDNCEQVIVEVASVAEELLRNCPLLTVLTTSRESLALSGEFAYRLPSMDPKAASDLFVTRVQQSDTTWFVDAERHAVVTDICKNLDGIPLAIELAASHVSTLGLEALRARLLEGIILSGSRGLPLHHQTMTATIAWSYDLLADAEAQLLRRLSVLAGGFTLELAESVGHEQALPVEAVADVLAHLVQKSLVSVNHLGTATRYGFLESIRTFALKRLTEASEREKDGIVEETMLRLMEWLSQQAAILESARAAPVLTALRYELDNVAAALSWALSTGDAPAIMAASRLFVAFRLVWAGTSRQMEFRGLGLRLLDRLSDEDAPELVGLVIFALGPYLGEAKLLSLSQRAIPLLVAAGYGARAGEMHGRCAQIESLRGDAHAAERHLQLGQALFGPDELKRTRFGLAFACNAGYVRCLLQDFDAAKALLISLEIPPRDIAGQVDVHVVRAFIEFHQGHAEVAIELLSALKEQLGTDSFPGWPMLRICGDLAEYYLYGDNILAADEEIRACLTAALEARNAWMAVTACYARDAALVAARCGSIELAVRLLGASDAHYLSEPGAAFDPGAVATKIVEAELSPARADALRGLAANEDLYDLFEEFLAHPTASESARLSATSSPRATSVTRSSPN